MDIYNTLFTDTNFEEFPFNPRTGFIAVESDIRTAHPDKYTPLTDFKDARFDNRSWMRFHAWSLTYLTLWSAKPTNVDSKFTNTQYLVSLSIKPIAAVFDGVVNTTLLPLKLIVLADRVLVFTMKKLLRLDDTPNALTVNDAAIACGNQFNHSLYSILRIAIQPVNLIANLISPKWDLILRAGGISCLYKIVNEKGETEVLIDHGKIKHLRERCGWHEMTNELFRTLGGTQRSRYSLRYFHTEEKPCITAYWEDVIYVGDVYIAIPRQVRNY